MVQLGWNAGPRNATIWGLAKSYVRKLDMDTMISRDEDIIAVISLFWSLVKAVMPTDVTDHIEQCLSSSGLPTIATQNVDEGECAYSMLLQCDMLTLSRCGLQARAGRQNI